VLASTLLERCCERGTRRDCMEGIRSLRARRGARAIGVVIAFATLLACGEGASEGADLLALRFSAIPDEKPTEQRARFEPVAAYLEEKLDVKVEYVPLNRYSASVQAFVNGDVHVAWFGGLSGVQARLALPGSQALAQGAEDPHFYSYFIAHKDTGLAPSEAFPLAARGRKFTFGSEGSTSGRLMPEYFIRRESGEDPQSFFSDVGFSGNHPATLAAVNTGAFEIGALNYRVYDNAAPEDRSNTRVIWKTPLYADYNLTSRADLDRMFGKGFTRRLQKAFLEMPTDLCERSFSRSRMIAANTEDFAMIEQTAKELGLAR
jgi:phosphonate transport system substrate-binding protein